MLIVLRNWQSVLLKKIIKQKVAKKLICQGVKRMIRLTKLNNEEFVLNSSQIECIEIIPESKVILMNKDFYIVKERADEIINRIIEYNAKVYARHQQITIINDIVE